MPADGIRQNLKWQKEQMTELCCVQGSFVPVREIYGLFFPL